MPLLALLLLFAPLAASAQEAPAPTPDSKQNAAEMTLMMLSQSLALTPAQQDQLRPILRDKFKKAEEIRHNAALTSEQKRAQWQELYQSGRQQADAILTAQQKETLDRLATSLNNASGHLSKAAPESPPAD
ncbi:MAG: hypothetical protein PW734_07985 [Verrucomicrobium sp.]|nr:hypothetical protein [Verrucomicrobium sp.]